MAGSTVRMEEPVCLIENDPEGNLRVVSDAVTILEGIQQPVVVVAVVGLYRTGKSYLMNKLALKQKGFALGATIESETKGIWMWCVPHPSKPGHTLVLLDTEGLGDAMKGDEKNDTWIFCLAVLLSSVLVYNSMGTIDNKALENINYITELSEHINVKTKAKGEEAKSNEFLKVFPSFIWTVRDFTLLLQLNGQPITADEYLENSLKLVKGDPLKIKQYKKIEEYNRPRECLRKFFQRRKCFVFERPATTEDLQRMEKLTDADLEPKFVQQAKEFCDYIYTSAKTKTMIGGLEVTGSMLANLAVMYTKAISSDQIPCLDSAVEALAKIQNHTAVTKALEHYQTEMARQVTFPTKNQKVLSHIHGAVNEEALNIFMSLNFKDKNQSHHKQLMRQLQSDYDQICKKNIEESQRVCRAVITRVFRPLERALRHGSYRPPGGYTDYCENIMELIQQYKSERGKGLMSEEVLSDYLEGKANEGGAILAADQYLSKEQRKMKALSTRAGLLTEMDLVPSVHKTVGCDGCQMFPIQGPRFKCRNCDDFDFCEKCFKTCKHKTRHSFGMINEPAFSAAWKDVIGNPNPQLHHSTGLLSKMELVHKGVWCNGCWTVPIQGPRFKCRNCDNFDFCEKCFKTCKHITRHSFGMINEPAFSGNGKMIVDFSPLYNWTGLLSEMELVPSVHPRTECDGCQMFPIQGPRFKCRNCDDFDFCEKCFKTRKHNTRHSFGMINEPGAYMNTDDDEEEDDDEDDDNEEEDDD